MQVNSSSSTLTNVNDQATNVTLLAANGNRREAIIFNDSTSTLYVKFGATATTTSYTHQLGPGDSLMTDYQGNIDGIWSSDASGAARITELNP